MRLIMLRTALTIGLLISAVPWGYADDYPTRPITVIIPFPAGGPTDAIVRNLGDRMRISLGQPLIIENVSGANGTVATGRAYRAPPDGYTIICGHGGTFAINGALLDLPYDLVTGFTPISLLPSNPYLIVGKNDLPVNSLGEFLTYLKANSGKINMGHPGAGSNSHLLALQLARVAGATMNYVPYRGAAPAMNDLVGGQIDLMIDQLQSSLGRVKGGLIKAFAITAPTRSKSLPDVPTVDEAGAPGLYTSQWYGFWAPRATPSAIVQKLQAAVQDALTDPGVIERLTNLGMEIPPREKQTPEALTAQQKADIAVWWPLIKSENIKIQ